MLSMPRIVRPDLFRFHRKEIGFPVTREPIAPLGRTKNCATFCPGNQLVKRDRSRPNCEVEQLRFHNQNRFPYGLRRTFYHLGFGLA